MKEAVSLKAAEAAMKEAVSLRAEEAAVKEAVSIKEPAVEQALPINTGEGARAVWPVSSISNSDSEGDSSKGSSTAKCGSRD